MNIHQRNPWSELTPDCLLASVYGVIELWLKGAREQFVFCLHSYLPDHVHVRRLQPVTFTMYDWQTADCTVIYNGEWRKHDTQYCTVLELRVVLPALLLSLRCTSRRNVTTIFVRRVVFCRKPMLQWQLWQSRPRENEWLISASRLWVLAFQSWSRCVYIADNLV